MEKLNHIKCEYIGNNEFMISWDKEKYVSPSVFIFELVPFEQNKVVFVDRNKIVQADFSEGSKKIKASSDKIEHKFIVIGVGTNLDEEYNNLKKWCNEQDWGDLCVKGVSVEGNLEYKIDKVDNETNLVKLTADTDIPVGFIFYSYFLEGKKFRFQFPDEIIKNESREYHIKVPGNMCDFVIEKEGCKIELKNVNSDERNGNAASGIIGWFRSLFRT